MDEDRQTKVRAAKERAAKKAFEAYAASLEEELGSEHLADDVDASSHAHDAFLMLSKPLYVRCTWEFSCHPAVVAAAAKRALDETKRVEEAKETPP